MDTLTIGLLMLGIGITLSWVLLHFSIKLNAVEKWHTEAARHLYFVAKLPDVKDTIREKAWMKLRTQHHVLLAVVLGLVVIGGLLALIGIFQTPGF